jgi:HSP20 family molecular chaperone IbpA
MTHNIPALLLRTFSAWEGTQENTDISGSIRDLLQTQGVDVDQFHSPPVDVTESNTNITLYMDIPGVSSDSIDVDFYNNKIEVTGDRVKPYETSQRREIAYGRFKRIVTIPISVTSRESVNVTSDDGVLCITIDKENEEKNKFKVRIGEPPAGTSPTGRATVSQ